MHALTFHDKEPDAMGVCDELREGLKFMRELYKLFPKVDVCLSNHTSRPYRVAAKAGLPENFMKTYREWMEAPEGWRWAYRWIDNGVQYLHGMGYSGQNGAINCAVAHRISTCIGHLHSYGGISYRASEFDMIFGMNVGCLMDVTSYAARYGINYKDKPTIGCGVVINSREAYFIPMDLGSKINYT